MSGNFREYNWSDILKLILKDAGLEDEASQRTRGQVWYVGSFAPPTHEKDTCIRVQVYDKPYSERIQEHAG
jgi:7-keto-8-aminopelargonate synthetase-like enzyme